jgi:predicted signal transduction protein with EAL and GGDEF domain
MDVDQLRTGMSPPGRVIDRAGHAALTKSLFSGTGQSGLSQHRQRRSGALKIDRPCVDGRSCSVTQWSVVDASRALARDLGMRSVAEDAREQWAVRWESSAP